LWVLAGGLRGAWKLRGRGISLTIVEVRLYQAQKSRRKYLKKGNSYGDGDMFIGTRGEPVHLVEVRNGVGVNV
jgi:hypothetical protein